MSDGWEQRLTQRSLSPAHRPWTRRYVAWMAVLAVVIAWGFVAFAYQWRHGLVATDMRDRISWGLYITAFVFFIGISHAGTLISAILRATNATWRTPITRIAEAITVVSLVSGALFVIVDMGRPERLYQFWLNGNWQSPLMWDMMAITIYLTGSVLYLYVPMIPDLALFRDNLDGRVNGLRGWAYRTFALGWSDTGVQRKALVRSVAILMVLIIPIAVSVHTVVSWIFAMTSRVSWDSTIFGIFFVAGAIYSGIATLIVVLAVMRRIYHLEEYITPLHFKNLAYLMMTMSLLMIYGNASEYITKGYKMHAGDTFAFEQLFAGEFAPMYWFYFFGGLVVPFLIVAFKPTRTLTWIVIAAVLVDLGMFVERYFIVVGGLRVPTMPYEPSTYAPSWVEWSILASGCAGFMLLLTLFARHLPILAVWEMKVEHEESLHEAPTSGEEELEEVR